MLVGEYFLLFFCDDDQFHRRTSLGSLSCALTGFSLGARVIFYALLDLFRTSSFGIVQDVYLMGATVSVGASQWLKVRMVKVEVCTKAMSGVAGD